LRARELVLVANARLPSQRAQSLQVAQVAAAFERAGVATTLLHALRRDTPEVQNVQELWDYYAIAPGARPKAQAAKNIDWIDLVPRRLQYLPARLQELSFARNAAKVVLADYQNACVLSRELECARRLVRAGRKDVFLEIHRVPGGSTRRRWLLEAATSAAGVIAISGGVRDDLITLGIQPERLLVAHDGFERERFANMPSRADARRELRLAADKPLVVYTGGLLAWKGVDILIEAARLLPTINFVIAGGMDADVRTMSHLASGLDNVRLDGFQAPERVATYLAAGDVGVVPNRSQPSISSRYTSPLKVFEAQAAGLPLVVSDLPSLRDVLTEDQAAFVRADDPKALAQGLRELIKDEARLKRFAGAMKSASQGQSWDARAKRVLDWMSGRLSISPPGL
jgi:glycosyltransferase involved in cell wall biosynthesis